MTDPTRTHAIVVGIEAYAIGRKWNLPGPAGDALDCVDWLLACGVPVANISLLLSPLADQRDAHLARAAAQGFAPQDIAAADFISIENAFDAAELIEDGELLVVFWGGHGVVDLLNNRALFCADATEQNKRSISLTLRLLRLTCTVTKAFPEQAIFVDACANFLEKMRWKTGSKMVIPDGLERRAGVRQGSIFAAASGQTAAQDQVQRYGAFSRIMLKELNNSRLAALNDDRPQLPPDLHGVGRKVQAHFEQLNADDPSGQTPVCCFLKGFDQNEEQVHGVLPMSGAVQTAARKATLAPRQLDRLFAALKDCAQLETRAQRDAMLTAVLSPDAVTDRSADRAEDLHACVLELASQARLTHLCDWLQANAGGEGATIAALEVRRRYTVMRRACAIRSRLGLLVPATPAVTASFLTTTSNRYADDIPEDLLHALEQLLGQPDAAGVPRVLAFLLRLEHECGVPGTLPADLLEELGADAAKANELRQTIATGQRPRARLIIDFHGDRADEDQGWPAKVRAWVRDVDGKWGPYKVTACDGTPAGAQAAFAELLAWGRVKAQGKPIVELIVPRCLFATEFPQWQVAEAMGRPRPVGTRYPLVLRWGERVWWEELQVSWRERSEKLRQALAATDPKIRWVCREAAADPEDLYDEIEEDFASHCIGLEFAPEANPADLTCDPLVAALRAGSPYALWFTDIPDDLESLKSAVRLRLVSEGVDDFPAGLNRLRSKPTAQEVELAKRLTVLWDDPAGLPPREFLTEP